MSNLDSCIDSDADILVQNVARQYKPVFKKGNNTGKEKRAIYRYLFSGKPRKLPPSLKGRIINLYDPLADRTRRFPDGLRFCLNVYVGCRHSCGYCYVNGYSRNSVGSSPHAKTGLREKLVKDLRDLETLGVPTAPLHMSNSTDICQEELETKYRDTLFALGKIMESRNLFSSLVLLTKNPKILCEKEYLSILRMETMKPLVVQVTCAYFRDEGRRFYEPDAPNIESRLKALRFLAENNIETEMRIDPLFPSSAIRTEIRGHKPLNHYVLPETQTMEDLTNLIKFAQKSGVKTIIASALKIPISDKARKAKKWFGGLYKDAGPNKQRLMRGGSWRLPENYQKELIFRVAKICKGVGIRFKHCKVDVLTRK